MTKKKPVRDLGNPSGDFAHKQMILKVDPEKHKWIRAIADETAMTQPNVVNLILAQAVKNDPTEYIDQIKQLHAKEALKKLDEDSKRIDQERKRLNDLLNHQ